MSLLTFPFCPHNLNRIAVAVLSIIGMVSEDAWHTDLLMVAALIIWLWMPELNRLEADWFKHRAAGDDRDAA